MSKEYPRKTTRSRRKQSQLRGKFKGVDEASVQLSLPFATPSTRGTPTTTIC